MVLVTYDEQAAFLDLEPGQDKDLIEDLLAQTQALFEKESGRADAPFGVAIVGRTEIHQVGPGSTMLTLDYPIASITSIVSGRDVASPDETILPGDASTVVWQVGSRDLIRVDGGYWRRWYPSWVKVVYNTQADQPADVKPAIMRRVATIYHGRGKEGFSSVTRGSRSWAVADGDGENDPIWQNAVANHRRGWFK